jgi:hypothetical protein
MSSTINGYVTRVDTEQKHRLGSLFVDYPEGTALSNTAPRVWVYVKAEDALAEGSVVMRKAATLTHIGIDTTGVIASHRIVGVAQHTIADNSYGWILAKGIGEVMSNGTTTADTAQVSAASGECTDCTTGTNDYGVFCVATEADTGASTLVTCWINCLGT